MFLCRAGCGERFYTLDGRREHEGGHFVGVGGRVEGELRGNGNRERGS